MLDIAMKCRAPGGSSSWLSLNRNTCSYSISPLVITKDFINENAGVWKEFSTSCCVNQTEVLYTEIMQD